MNEFEILLFFSKNLFKIEKKIEEKKFEKNEFIHLIKIIFLTPLKITTYPNLTQVQS